MALALTLVVPSLSPGHIHYINLGMVLNLLKSQFTYLQNGDDNNQTS